ncbi:MAG TPA: Wzz/FepE/Etk N-terminal domain-containing protein, partial [Paracoccaceae bacterium]
MGQIQSLDEFIGLLIRRRYLIGAILGIGMALSLLAALSLGKTWEAGAVIQVETPVVADGARTAGGQSAQRLQAIEQRLTTRDNLIAMIERHGLYADAPGLSLDQKVALLRRSVTFQSVAAVGQQGFGAPASVSALIVSARLGNGDQAARVANDLAQSVLDLSAARQSQRTQETLQFFIDEERRVGAEIVALEADIVAFKNRNSAALPATRD